MNEAKFTLTPENKKEVMRLIWDNLNGWFENGNLEITIRPRKSKRSVEQNRRLWKIYGELADKAWVDGRRFDANTWHEYCKGVFIGFDIRDMPDGTEVKIPISTTTLNTAEMAEYQNNIQARAAVEFGIIWEF
ncbi:TPA: recombination protein NinB [Neisseria gonorrhoeae]|uniref:recombination protein NinB n=2 Tax=Neisseria gonorrhoeae TaxID=485 RepID=UPI0014677C85|nr:recombination protein NinB [Neisseria gonorrhoeae]GFM00164.1 phage associated protein [Neisseria gonorrhoeae]